MRKIVLLAAMLAMSVMMMAPGAAIADDLDFDGFDDEEEFSFEDGFFFPFFFEVEIDDIDCDGSDDDGDGEIDEDIVCVVEFDIDYDGFDGDGDGFDEDFFDD
ncbi:MAG: hypothetical protein M3N45_05155 [Actinomycetota bacterium]|nr:hypothetical protein [Actinomycetota bacterium]